MKKYSFDKDTGQISENTKPITRSLTVLGGAIAVLAPVWNTVLESLPEISESIDVIVAAGVLSPHVTATVQMIGGLIAIYGRVRATKQIKVLDD